MSKSRRNFLASTSISLLGAATGCSNKKHETGGLPAGTPPAFGTAPPVGPEVSSTTFAEAEKLVQLDLRASDRALAAGNWRNSMAALYERRTGPRKVALEPAVAPWSQWSAMLPGQTAGPDRDLFARSRTDPGPLPESDGDIAFAPVTRLSRWIEQRKLTSQRLTQIYLTRLERFDPKLHCVITLTREQALAQARKADQEIAAGKYRGPLHGIPWGAKDLLDTAGIPTTYGAEPYRDRVPSEDSAVVKRLNDAGAVLVAKLSMGATHPQDMSLSWRCGRQWHRSGVCRSPEYGR